MSLRNYKAKDMLFQEGELFLINPKKEERDKLTKVVRENQNLNLNGEDVNVNVIRYILENLTNFAEEVKTMEDEEILEILDDGIPSLNRMTDKIAELINDIAEEILRMTSREINNLITILDILQYSEQEDKMFEKMTKLLKKNKINITKEELKKLKDKPEEMMALLNRKKLKR